MLFSACLWSYRKKWNSWFFKRIRSSLRMLRLYITQSGNIGISLITPKSRIVPKRKKFTIPRLELLGNYILSRLTVSVLSTFSNEIIIDNVYCWSDSQISLARIKAVDKEFRVFVQNRAVDIRRNFNPNSWFYCRTYDNPAHIITRFKTESLESLHMWWNGPCFLKSVMIQMIKMYIMV